MSLSSHDLREGLTFDGEGVNWCPNSISSQYQSRWEDWLISLSEFLRLSGIQGDVEI